MFKYQSYLRFHKTVGQVDAVVTFTELAVRELRRGWQDAGSTQAYLESLSKELGVFVTHVDLNLLTKRTNQLHIVSLVQHFEAFLHEIGDEHPAKRTWPKRRSEEPLLEYTWKHITKEAAVPRAIKTEWDLMEYYRDARNWFLHSVDKKDPKARDLKERVAQHPRLSKIKGGPNSYSDLRFEDFVLAARASETIGKSLSALGRPTDRQITDMVIREKTKITAQGQIDKKIRVLLATRYGMQGDECTGVVGMVLRAMAEKDGE
jgi:hypothetical protein